MIPSSRLRWLTPCLALLACLTPCPVQARPPYKQALIDLLGDNLPARLRDCRACHLEPPPDEPDERPHHAFGGRLKALRGEMTRAGKKTDITARLLVALDEDSDHDGVPNGVELFAGTSPGMATDVPRGAGLENARTRYARWLAERRHAYAWQPFEPVRRPQVPAAGTGWARNPLDAFLASEHARRELQPRPEAARHVLLRRVHLDLIGLPPTREELQAFEADPSPDAYEKVVERLLASPRHGERWGRHWMDVWRYADWAGYGAEVRDSQKHIWHWRDWIIDSVNADRGYDRMIREMLAADEVAPLDTDALRATGFLVRNWYLFNRNVWLDRTVEHTGKAFLGLTLNCARCHDHFYDPIPMREYYAFRAIFEPHKVRTDRVPGSPNVNLDGLPRVYDAEANAPTFVFERGNEALPDRSKVIPPGIPASLGGRFGIAPVALPPEAHQPDRRSFVIAETIEANRQASQMADTTLQASRRRLAAAQVPPLGPRTGVGWVLRTGRALAQFEADRRQAETAQTKHQELLAQIAAEKLESEGKAATPTGKDAVRAAAKAQRQRQLAEQRLAVAQAELTVLTATRPKRAAAQTAVVKAKAALAKLEASKPSEATYTRRAGTSYPASSTGRRRALAEWIASRDNPLAARVLVNHVWLRHFGRGIVPTEFDFGKNGQAPTHPALLDWLAAEFMEQGWNMKALHRTIVTSAAYRMESTATPAQLARDPDNRFLWRMNPRRMEGEVVRDSLLALADRLDLRMGGPDIDHRQGLTVSRRSVYFQHAAEKQVEFLLLFDGASVNECYRRSESIVPQQALALANSTLAVGMSRVTAGRLSQETAQEDDFVRAAYEKVLSRPPSGQELAACREFLAGQEKLLAAPQALTRFDSGPASTVPPSADARQRARENLIHVLLNLHEFVSIR